MVRMTMSRVTDPTDHLRWLRQSADEDSGTGFDLEHWPSSTWVLHAMYENPLLEGLGTHDDLHRRRLDASDAAPLIIDEATLDGLTTVTGVPLGFVVRPGRAWRRVSWKEYLDRTASQQRGRDHPPCFRWFPPGSWPVAVEPPAEGSLDDESLLSLVDVLASCAAEGLDTECLAYYAPLAADFDSVHLWQGPLSSVRELVDEFGGPYRSSPSNIWPRDRSWFVWTDHDLQGTKVSGTARLIEAVRAHPALETHDWMPAPT